MPQSQKDDAQPQPEQKAPAPTFRDVYQKGYAYSGKRVKLEEVLGREILIREYVRRASKFAEGREMAVIHAYSRQVNPEQPYDFSFATGSRVILEQLERTKDQLPYRARVVKLKNYYSLA